MKKFICLLGLCAVLCSCAGTTTTEESTTSEKSLKEMYSEAYTELSKKNFDTAAEMFQNIESQYSTSQWAGDSLVMLAYSRYLDEDFGGTILAIDRFMRFHPGDDNVPYMMYLRGMSYYAQVSDVRREPGMSVYALQQFQQLINRFPKTDYAKNAQNKVLILKNYIAGKMMYAARDDMHKQNWTSAISRLQIVVQTMQETVMTPEALYRLTECYDALGVDEQVRGFSEMLKTNFPDNEWTKKLK
ncbi:MAG: outer membrane protein assembly factor BamD [Alphaproteobacteria bacterium]|nr:outer membrane protein assembly factor BamD [Alphaproteobacteria bacterium]